jgi:hypothetical protein
MHAEHLRARGDIPAAERRLLPFAADRHALRALRNYAALTDDWDAALDRSRTLVREDPSDTDRIAHARILAQHDEPESRRMFEALAGDESRRDDIREQAFSALAAMALQADRYADAVAITERWHAALPASADGIWNLLFALHRSHAHDRAYETYADLRPDADNPARARLAGAIVYRRAAPADAIRQLDALSERYGRSEEALEGLIIAASLDAAQSGEPLPEDCAHIVAEVRARFSERFPQSQVIQTVDAPQTVDEFAAFVRDQQADNARAQRDLLQAIVDARASVAMLAAIAPSADVCGTWARLGFLPLGMAEIATDAHEKTAARTTRGSAAVWDPAALFVANALGPKFADLALAAFPGALLANATLDDLDTALARMGGGGGRMEVGYDPEGDRPFVIEIPAEQVAVDRERARGTLDLAKRLDATPGAFAELDPDLARVLDDEEAPFPLKTLVETIAIAEREGRPIYSDDRWIRAAARQLGIPAFGTIALIDALHDEGAVSSEDRLRWREHLVAQRGWGLRLEGHELVRLAEGSSWKLTTALAGALNDRAAWREGAASTCVQMTKLLEAAAAVSYDVFALWLERVVDAGQTAAPELPPSMIPRLLMLVAIEERLDRGDPERFLHELCRGIRALPTWYREPGVDVTLVTVGDLLARAAGRPDVQRFLWFREIFRLLPANEQFRVWNVFVAR